MFLLLKIGFAISLMFILCNLILPLILLSLRVPTLDLRTIDTKDYQLYLLVPMHNEAKIVQRTLDAFLTRNLTGEFQYNVHWVIVEDGSTDHTQSKLKSFDKKYPNLNVIYRKINAATGKGAALNAGLDYVFKKNRPEDFAHIVVGVLDADGYMAGRDLHQVLKVFKSKTEIMMVQTAVAMLGTQRWLALLQDYEFQIGNTLLQNLRGHLGNVAGSGNGQFFRLSALPRHFAWGNTLLEDFEISTKLLLAKKPTFYLYSARVFQEATISWGAYLKQRTRWALGGLQCLKKFYTPIRQSTHLSLTAKFEMLSFLWAPILSIFLAILNMLALWIQLQYIFFYQTHLSYILLALLGTWLVENLVLVFIYRMYTQCTWRQYWLIIATLPFYGLFALPVCFAAISQYVHHQTKWDKTEHGII